MEEEIDLRPYLEVLLQQAKWIIGTAVLFAIIAFTIIYFSQNTYKATALVFVTENSDIFRFDPRIEEVTNREPLTALPELAESDMILAELIKDEAVVGVSTIEALRKMVLAESGSDRSIIRLSVTAEDPEKSARIANLWAELFITQINTIMGIQDDGQVTFFGDQLAQAEQALQTAEDNLVTFQEINRSSTISNTLTFYNQEQTLYLANQQDFTRLIQDAIQLREQLASQPGNNPASISDQIVGLTLQMEGFNSNSPTPLFLQIDSDTSLIGNSKNEQLAFLDRLIELLQFKLSMIESRLSSLESEILQLQQEWQEAVTTYERLANARLIANETYLSLARKVEEEKITTQDENRGLRIISEAVIPNVAESRNTVLFTFAAGIIGTLVSIVVLFTITWWRQVKANS